MMASAAASLPCLAKAGDESRRNISIAFAASTHTHPCAHTTSAPSHASPAASTDEPDDCVTTDVAHPYGVQPEGNLFLLASSGASKPVNSKQSGLGNLRVLSDTHVLDLLSYLDAPSLSTLACVSRAFYVFANHWDAWRARVLTEMSSSFVVRDHWRNIYTHTRAPHARAHTAFPVQGFYSDLLFKAWLCAAADISPAWLKVDNIPRRSAKDMSVQQFREEFEIPNRPVIITDVVNAWPAYKEWNMESLAEAVGSSARFDAGGFSFPFAQYAAYAQHALHLDDQPLYLFDKTFADRSPSLGRAFTVPPYFSEDLFSVMHASRPDHRWLIIGPAKSGSVFHKDPNATSAWNAVISGAKKWILFPPDVPPPGVHASADGSEVATMLSPMEWMLDFYEPAQKLAERMRRRASASAKVGVVSSDDACRPRKRARPALGGFSQFGKRASGGVSALEAVESWTTERTASHGVPVPVEGVCRAGEVMFVPRGWWHLVINTEDSIAITQNYVSSANLPHVLAFLRHMPYAVSGVSAERCETLFSEFRDALRMSKPEVLDAAMATLCAAGVSIEGEPSPSVCRAEADVDDGTAAAEHASEAPGRSRWQELLAESVRPNAVAAPAAGDAAVSAPPSKMTFAFAFTFPATSS